MSLLLAMRIDKMDTLFYLFSIYLCNNSLVKYIIEWKYNYTTVILTIFF